MNPASISTNTVILLGTDMDLGSKFLYTVTVTASDGLRADTAKTLIEQAAAGAPVVSVVKPTAAKFNAENALTIRGTIVAKEAVNATWSVFVSGSLYGVKTYTALSRTFSGADSGASGGGTIIVMLSLLSDNFGRSLAANLNM